jgi:CRP/FNR family transcriptional regulator, cyclic AMP receptor protein
MKKALIILSTLDDSDVEWMIRNGRKVMVAAGATLIRFGRQVDCLYFVLDGMFSVVSDPMGGKEVARLSAGEVLGEMSFVDSRPPSATVRAIVESPVLAISRRALIEKLEEDIAFAARFYKAIAVFLSDRLRATTSHLGYGEQLQLDENIEDKDELSPDLLDSLSMAGSRFAELERRTQGPAAERIAR